MHDFEFEPTILTEPRVSGALFGAVAAGQVRRDPDGRDYLSVPENRPIDVTDYMAATEAAGYTAINAAGTWELTETGRQRAAYYAASALLNPDVLHLRKSWAAMSGALVRLGNHQRPTPDQLVDIPSAHALLLLGQATQAEQMRELFQRHIQAKGLAQELLRTIGPEGPFTRESWAAYRLLAFLRGESLADLDAEPPTQFLADAAVWISAGMDEGGTTAAVVPPLIHAGRLL